MRRVPRCMLISADYEGGTINPDKSDLENDKLIQHEKKNKKQPNVRLEELSRATRSRNAA